MQNKIEETLKKYLYEDETVLLANGFEDAFVGIGRQSGKAVALYDREKCVFILVKNENMNYTEALEYFSFNVENSYVGENTPVFIETK